MDQGLPQSTEGGDSNTKFSCNECKRRRIKCSREIPTCFLCTKYKRHCLYEKHSKTPLTRKHLTEVEEELWLVKALLKRNNPELDIPSMVLKLKNGYDINEFEDVPNKRIKLNGDVGGDNGGSDNGCGDILFEADSLAPIPSPTDQSDLQIPQLLPPILSPTLSKRKLIKSEISPNSNYNWDERKLGDTEEPSIIDGMATTESNSYLGAASNAALINLVGGGFFLYNKKSDSSPRSSTSSNPSTKSLNIPKPKLEYYINQYFDTYHISYPIVHKPLFMAQFNEIIPQPSNGWDSLMYIMAAIGSFMTAISPDENDDLILFEKAKRKLSIDDLETGNLVLVQTLTLMSNYLQKRDRPNSGYNYLGLAVRMALGLGLHKQVDESSDDSLLNQEMKRRVWWCIYIFDCGQTITYGRPLGIPCAGIDTRLPLNILDTELTTLTTIIPKESDNSPTIYTSVRLQSSFHLLTNSIYERIITDPFPTSGQLLNWDHQYLQRWRKLIPAYFDQLATVPMSFKLAHAVLHWRYRNLRIIMYRTFLLKKVVINENNNCIDSDITAGEICLKECSTTIRTMDTFWDVKHQHNRMDAWYSLFFLIPAVVMPLVCVRNDPTSLNATTWRQDITIAKSIIQRLINICPTANRILNLIDSLGSDGLTDSINFPTEDSPTSQLIQLHSMLWPGSFDIEQQFL